MDQRTGKTGMTGWYKPDGTQSAPATGSALFEGFCRMFFTWYCPLMVEGRHHLPDGPFLLCSNHCSHADSAALMTASGRSFRSFALLGASDYFFHSRRVLWSVSPLMNVIPIERSPGPKSLTVSLQVCRRFLERTRGCLILYPEGTRSPDGEMRMFKTGAGLFASELGVPLIPAYIDGTHRILPKGHSLPRPGRLTVRFGEALSLEAAPQDRASLREWRRSVVEQLAYKIRQLSFGHQERELTKLVRPKGIPSSTVGRR
jgi:1-acyl-sn-glycerol-3-phosphate acyltransferase